MSSQKNIIKTKPSEPVVRVGIVGGAGYTGGELIRLLINHPHAEIVFIHSKSNASNFVHHVHSDLVGETDLKFTGDLADDIDVMFLCVGHGEARKFLQEKITVKIKQDGKSILTYCKRPATLICLTFRKK